MTMESFWTTQFDLGSFSFTPVSLLLGLTLITIALFIKRFLHRLLTIKFFPRFKINPGLANAYSTLVGYGFLVLAMIIVLPVAFPGFDWSALSVMLGAVSFGVGFGLRNVTDNFVSGLIILLERPVKVGDRITIDGTSGTIKHVRARSTTVQTNDNIEVIVPNSRFISEAVVNWSHSDNQVRLRLPVGVHYNSDVLQVRDVLEKAVLCHPEVLRDPPPSAKFVAFGDSSLNFEIWVWTVDSTQRPAGFKSDLNYLIWQHLKDADIEIPYPQRDLYIKQLPENAPAMPGNQ